MEKRLFGRRYELNPTQEQLDLVKKHCRMVARAKNRLIYMWKQRKTISPKPPRKAKGKAKHWIRVHKNQWNDPFRWFLTFRHGRERLPSVSPESLKKRIVRIINHLYSYEGIWRNAVDAGLSDVVNTINRFYSGLCRPPRFIHVEKHNSIGVKNRVSDIGRIDNEFLIVSKSIGGTYLMKKQPIIDAPIRSIKFRVVGDRLFASCLYEAEPPRKYRKPNKLALTIDFNMQSCTVFDRKRFAKGLTDLKEAAIREELKIAKLQRQGKRMVGYLNHETGQKQKPSRRYRKLQKKISKAWFDRANRLNDLRHKFTTAIVEACAHIGYQHDNLKGMQKSRPSSDGKKRRPPQMGKSILHMGIGEIIRQLDYKGLWAGRKILDCQGATSKTCSLCGYVNCAITPLCTAHIARTRKQGGMMTCFNCNETYDRDENATRNMMEQLIVFFFIKNPPDSHSPPKTSSRNVQ